MNFSTIIPVTDRFSLSMDGLRRAVAARIAGGRLPAVLILLIWGRLRRIETRVLALVAAIRAGRLRARRRVAEGSGVERMAVTRIVPRSSPGLPRGFGWLLPLVPYEAAGFASQLRVVLADPEMVALLAATPQLGKVLRPLCRMLGIEVELVSPVPAVAIEAKCEVPGSAGEVTALPVEMGSANEPCDPDQGNSVFRPA